MKKDKQIPWIDYARSAAVVLVVLCHAAEELYGTALKGERIFGPYRWTGFTIMFLAGRIGVPVFLGLTGTLMLGRRIDASLFYKKTLLPLILTSEIWIVITYFQVMSIRENPFNAGDLIRQMLFIDAGAFGYLWYIPMIIGIYIALPFLTKVTADIRSPKDMKVILTLSFLYFLVMPEINELIFYWTGKESFLGLQLEMKLWGGAYVLYMVFGYFIGKYQLLARVPYHLLLIFWGVSFFFNFLIQFLLNQFGARRSTAVLQYNMVGIFMMGMLAFEIFRRCFAGRKTSGKLVRFISSSSFGIYLIHKPLQAVLVRQIPERINPLIRSALMFVISLALSIAIVWLVSRISKKAAKILFYYRDGNHS